MDEELKELLKIALDTAWVQALADDKKWMEEELWRNEIGVFSRQSFADGMAHLSIEKREYAGMPVPLMGESLIIEPSYYMADKQDELNRLMNPPKEPYVHVCKNEDVDETLRVRNTFWSTRKRAEVTIFESRGKIKYFIRRGAIKVDLELKTLGNGEAWSLETEGNALSYFRTLVTHNQLRQYLLTGAFIESSKRSNLSYIFRRLRPTIVLSTHTGRAKILTCLCLHPIAYYARSWAGAMCPTDDVIAHLMLMRGDEHMFWKRAEHHSPEWPSSGV